MAHTNEDHATLTSYAQALLELADARGVTDAVADDVAKIGTLIEQDRSFAEYVADPSVGHVDRDARLSRVFEGQAQPLTLSYLKMLSAKGRLHSFRGIAAAFKQLLDTRAGRIDVNVTVPQQLSSDELENVRHQIATRLSKDVTIHQHIDESIIGGLIVRIGDTLIDGSVKSQLETLKRRMIAAV
jgi:F-type H+-transporting ATPase subunit delta